ncbi:MAG: protein kinase domain-containing protein [Pirellulaceae bacterium]
MNHSEESIFNAAIEMPADQRDGFLDDACKGDQKLRERLAALVQAHEKPTQFLDLASSTDGDAPTTDAGIHAAAGSVIDHYKLLQKVGEGGFGVVYMAEQEQPLRRKVALKIIKPGMDTHAVIARFEAERQALAMMDHPNIARVLDGGTTDGRPYFVMELVRGVPITEYCDKNSLLTRQRLELFASVCKAVQHAHQKGIIHRDIKPSNVMVTLHDGQPVVKVIDFGVAKAIHQRLTERTMFTEYGQMIGTPQYMSPEQAEMSGLDVDTRSDIYSLGVLLFELLTGTTPLEARQLREAGYAEMQRMIREEEPPRPSHRLSTTDQDLTIIAKHRRVSPERLHREIKGDLDWIVMKALEKDRSRRYESALTMARDIERSLNDEPVEAGPPTLGYRMKKWSRRNRGKLAVAVATLLLVGILGIWGVSSWFAQRDQITRNSARLSNRLESAAVDVGRAINAPVDDEAAWIAARAGEQRVRDAMSHGPFTDDVRGRALDFLNRFDDAKADRDLAYRVENILISRATHDDLQSWEAMERQFSQLFLDYGIEFKTQSPEEIAESIRNHHSALRLADALELWIATKGQVSSYGGESATEKTMQPWADALYAADPDPLRTEIRKIVHERRPVTSDELESMITGVELQQVAPRTLSWLAIIFMMARDHERSNEIHEYALRYNPDDLMVNFDYALALGNQGRWDLAIRYFMRCTAIRPEVPGVWRSLGEALRENGELEASRKAIEYALELEPDHAATLVALAWTQLLEENYVAAEKTARSAESIIPQDAEAHALIGSALMGQNKPAEALPELEKCAELLGERRPKHLHIDQWIDDCRQMLEPSGQRLESSDD